MSSTELNPFWQYNNHSLTNMFRNEESAVEKFQEDFKQYLMSELTYYNIEIINFKKEEYDCSCFLKKDNKYLYICYRIPVNGEIISFADDDCFKGVLIRHAANDNDYFGGGNQFCSLNDLVITILIMFGYNV